MKQGCWVLSVGGSRGSLESFACQNLGLWPRVWPWHRRTCASIDVGQARKIVQLTKSVGTRSVWMPKTFISVGGAERFTEERNGVHVTVGVEVRVVRRAAPCVSLSLFPSLCARHLSVRRLFRRESTGGRWRGRRPPAGLGRTLG
jgi:hypothetical protein